MRIAKEASLSFKIAKPGDAIDGTLLKQEIDPWTVFTMSRNDIATKLGISAPKTHALIYELNIQGDPGCYKELRRKSQTFKGYSLKALNQLRDALNTINLDEIWQKHRSRLSNAKTKPRKKDRPQNSPDSLG